MFIGSDLGIKMMRLQMTLELTKPSVRPMLLPAPKS